AFERYAARAKAMVVRNQLLGNRGIFDALTDLACDKIRDQFVGLAVHQDIAEIAHPNAETGLTVELLPESLPLLLRHLEARARVGRMDEAAIGLLAARKNLGVIGPDSAHLLLGDLGVVQRRRPLGRALEYRQMASRFGNFCNGLHTSGASANHCDALTLEAN